jgi:hypothetical protein
MADTTITPAAGAMAFAGALPFRGLGVSTRSVKALFGKFDIWAATSSPVVAESGVQPIWKRARYRSTRYHINGQVLDSANNPLARTVYAIDETTGFRVSDPVLSDAGTGNFKLYAQTANPVILVAMPASGDGRNAPVLDRVVPVYP